VKVGLFLRQRLLGNGYQHNLTCRPTRPNYTYIPSATNLIDLRVNAYGKSSSSSTCAALRLQYRAGRVIEDQARLRLHISRFNLGSVRVAASTATSTSRRRNCQNRSTRRFGAVLNPSVESSISIRSLIRRSSYGISILSAAFATTPTRFEGSCVVASRAPPCFRPAVPTASNNSDERWSPKVTLAATPFSWLQPYLTTRIDARRRPSRTLSGGIHPAEHRRELCRQPGPRPRSRGLGFGAKINKDQSLPEPRRVRHEGPTTSPRLDLLHSDVHLPVFGPNPGSANRSLASFCNAPGTSTSMALSCSRATTLALLPG